MADEDLKRESAVYNDTRNRLRHTRDDLSDEEIDRIALAAVDVAVFGHDAKRDRKGNYIPQGIGAPGRETTNHFAAILKYEGRDAYNAAVAEIYKRDSNRARQLGLPQPVRAT